ncbi:sensor histidine kinase [Yoonia sp. R2331]|uniref:sensor histidine kinase n=1 Tax=Yoonia sp. R2331 TaxID=3237238 RepID=UPI0034E53800
MAGRLPVRIMLLLTLALLPLGYLGVIQTTATTAVADNHLRQSLIGATEVATQSATLTLENAMGVAAAMAGLTVPVLDQPAACRAVLLGGLHAVPALAEAVIVNPEGHVICATADTIAAPALPTDLADRTADGGLVIYPQTHSIATGDAMVSLLWPVTSAQGVPLGHVALYVPLDPVPLSAPDAPLSLSLYTPDGLSLLSGGDAPTMDQVVAITGGQLQQATAGEITGPDGTVRMLVVRPMIPDHVYAVATWPRPPRDAAIFGLPGPLFPLLMWGASLAVAYLAMHRLVVRHVQRLDLQMRDFGRHRRISPPTTDAGVPAEIRALEATFQGMALDLISEEARMEDALRDKNILIKEVHHRIKNNLQLVSSIMNLQVRETQSAEARDILDRLKDRVRGLATVYGHLYAAQDMQRTQAAQLLEDVFGPVLNPSTLPGARIDVQTAYDNANLSADQAVPLTLLASELAMLTLRVVLDAADQPHQIAVTFSAPSSKLAELRIDHQVPEGGMTPQEQDGLEMRLVQAFARQLDSTAQITRTDSGRSIAVAFDLQAFDYADRSF